ncbi:MAG TPA: UDP-4-amino-4,6-dideoxy-N-acetyl-beta-L-altrosamine transaminase [Sedimenticola sp.]|nr:UDP-4-amino-4,6-dideoxy-N-acetyl-beta-L-altrosamine transaminase [Sedimenticola sp.]
MSYIPYGRQDIDDVDVQSVVDVLRSDWLTQGPAVPRFEQALADRCGARHGVAVCNATAALHLACRALSLGPGGRLWTSPNTFVASANCARYCGADVDFVDIDPRTLNMSVDALTEKLARAEVEGKLPDIVVPVHFAGLPCKMDRIAELAERYGFAVVEDASHAVGASYQMVPTGACRYSDITVFSFHPVKILTTGEGGMLLTNRDDLAEQLRLLRSHGITRQPEQMMGASHGDWYYEQLDLGYNFRMTDMQAALGYSQLQRLDDFLARRCWLAARYGELLAQLPVGTQVQHSDAQSAWHLFPVRVAASSRRAVFDHMRREGIGVNVHYIPVHLQPYYRELGFGPGDFPEAERYYAEAISLPLFPSFTKDQQVWVVGALRRILGQ